MRYDSAQLIALEQRLSEQPRFRLLHGPTPIHELTGFHRLSGGPRIFVKRDDLTGLAFGGNKVRQAEYFVGAARSAGADTIVAGGSYAQSNHARIAAAATKAAGLTSVILARPGSGPASEERGGNALITRMIADDYRVMPELADVERGDRLREVEQRRACFETVADEYRRRGSRPYVLLGSSTPLGAVGYVAGTIELARQMTELNLDVSRVFVTSLGATHAGLLLGTSVIRADWEIVGVGYQPDAERAGEWVEDLVGGAAELLGLPCPEEPLRTVTESRFGGPSYGVPSAEGLAAMKTVAHSDALLLDPTYTAKGFAALLHWIETGRIGADENVLFLHTGGLPSLFAYTDHNHFYSRI